MSIRTSAAKASNSIEKQDSNTMMRRRISKACNYCRQRKIKCNGNTPCLNCQNHHIDCIYSKTIRKKKKQPSKKPTLQDLEIRLNKLDSKFEYLNDTITKVLDLLQKKNMKLDDKPKLKSRFNSKVTSQEEFEAIDEDEEFSDFNDLDEDEDEDEVDNEDDESNEDDDELSEESENDENYQHQQQPPLEVQKELTYPISPVESTDSSINDHPKVMTPPIAANNAIPSVNDNFSFTNSLTQYEFSMNTLEATMDNKLQFLYNEMPSIANQLGGEMY